MEEDERKSGLRLKSTTLGVPSAVRVAAKTSLTDAG